MMNWDLLPSCVQCGDKKPEVYSPRMLYLIGNDWRTSKQWRAKFYCCADTVRKRAKDKCWRYPLGKGGL